MNTKMKIIPSLVSVAVLAVASNSTFAAGTTAGTDIDNTASISYAVGGATQAPIESSEGGNSTAGAGNGTATTFVVDKKIDLTVTGTATDVSVAPGQTVNTSGTGPTTEISYTVTNTGNSDEHFNLTPEQVATSSPDDVFDTSACVVTAPALPGSDTNYFIAEDATINVTVQCDIPAADATVTNGAQSEVELLATAVTAATGTTAFADSGATETAAGVDIVLADGIGGTADEGFDTSNDGSATPGERNASHSATSSYVISTADLEVTKTSAVVYDPINLTSNPKRIPGAVIRYDITVENTGPAIAEGVVISDVIDTTNVQYETTIAPAAACTSTGTGVAFTCSESGGTVTSSAFDIPATTGTATMTFFVEIQ